MPKIAKTGGGRVSDRDPRRPAPKGAAMASSDPGTVTHAIGGAPTGEVPGDAPEGGNPPLPDPDVFDPAAHTVEQVNAYLDSLDGSSEAGVAEFARVVDAEAAGKARVGILGSAT